MQAWRYLFLAAALTAFGCDDDPMGDDAGGGGMDSGSPTDAGGGMDAGSPGGDGGPGTDGGDSDGGGADAGPGPTDAGPAVDACVPVTDDTSAIGMSCDPKSTECPGGYVCNGFSGIVVQYSCQIPCAAGCECPSGTTCAEVCDKAGCQRFCELS